MEHTMVESGWAMTVHWTNYYTNTELTFSITKGDSSYYGLTTSNCSGMISVYSVSLGMSDRYKFDIVY